MKKTIITLLILFLTFGFFADESKYTFDNLSDYFMNAPGATLPKEGEKVKVIGGLLAVEYAAIDGDGMDYLVKDATLKSYGYFSRLIYIYSENVKTHKTMSDGYWPSMIVIQNDLEIVYTGKTAPAVSAEGNRVEVPIFIGY